MATPEPKEYQARAILGITDALSSLLSRDQGADRLVVFKAPTGSGKTLSAAYALNKTFERPGNKDFIVLWLSPGKGDLHKQSKNALDVFLANTSMDVVLLDTRDDIVANAKPQSGQIFVVNWEKLRTEKAGEWANKLLKPGETENLFTLLTSASDSGLDMIVVIDESHTQLDGPQTIKLMNAIRNFRPFISLEISATPKSKIREDLIRQGIHFKVEIPFESVVEAQMVKKSAQLNPDFLEIQKSYQGDLDEQVMWAAWKKLETLTNLYKEEGSEVVPLLLIQYPDGKAAEARAQLVEDFLSARGLESDKTYATWLSEKHSPNLNQIAWMDSPYRALIFKQAIATGWDCPRAQVLVQFREPGSDTFQIQTLGRLMRAPEQKHYENEALNIAYVYSDLEDASVKVVTDEENFVIRDFTIKRGPKYPVNGLKLRSVFQPRRRDYHYPLGKVLDPILKNQLATEFEGKIPDEAPQNTSASVLVDAELEASKFLGGDSAYFEGLKRSGNLSERVVQVIFDQVLTSRIGPYSSTEQSRPRIKTSLVNWFKNESSWHPDEIQHYVLANREVFSNLIDRSCRLAAFEEEAKAVADARAKRRENAEWEVPESELIALELWQEGSDEGNLVEPNLIRKQRSGPEERFESWLAKQARAGKVEWWWKNGIRDEKYLGILYDYVDHESGSPSEEITYPDYLVMSKSGTIWCIEVKDIDDINGDIGGETEAKAKGLARWAQEMNEHSRKSEVLDLPTVRACVAVPSKTSPATVKAGFPDNWKAPTMDNWISDSGWQFLNLD
jgi:type III restriction enzyme